MRVFVSRHLLNENDVNMLETIETGHFNTSNYIRSVVEEVHLLNLINELLLFLSISLIFDISIHGRKNKTCVTKTLFTNFTRSNCFLQVWKNLFIVLKIRSHAKLTCIFVNCDVLFPSPPLLSYSTVCSAILTFHICTTQPSATNKGQRSSSRSS